MASSLDGRTLPSRWTPPDAQLHALYDELHVQLGGGSWLVGRATAQEFARRDGYAGEVEATFPRAAWLPHREATGFAFAIDAGGKVAWGRSEIGGDPIVVILTEQVSDAHLAGLRADGVGYVFAGTDALDLHAAMAVLRRELGVERLMLEGGGTTNGAFLRAGLIDEISLLLVPAIDGADGSPATFDGARDAPRVPPPVAGLSLKSHEVMRDGILWLRYAVRNR